MSERLTKKIIDSIAKAGPVSFEKFMDMALYDHEDGYYSGGKVKIGAEQADFTTSPHLSAIFGSTLARLIALADQELGFPEPFYVVESGPGEGLLAQSLLATLKAEHPDLFARLKYVLDETSPALKARQIAHLQEFKDVIAEFPHKPVDGVFLSNELIDAFPVHSLRVNDGQVTEIFVDFKDGNFVEVDRPVEGKELLEELAETRLDFEENFRFEVNLKAQKWLRDISKFLRSGYFLIIDYGDLEHRLYGPLKPEGTLRGFYRHQFTASVLENPGSADITASVNFSHLIGTAKALGFEYLFTNQRNFLFALGIADRLAKMEAGAQTFSEQYAIRQELWPLIFGGTGMGESFKALVLAKNAKLESLGLDEDRSIGAFTCSR